MICSLLKYYQPYKILLFFKMKIKGYRDDFSSSSSFIITPPENNINFGVHTTSNEIFHESAFEKWDVPCLSD